MKRVVVIVLSLLALGMMSSIAFAEQKTGENRNPPPPSVNDRTAPKNVPDPCRTECIPDGKGGCDGYKRVCD